MMVACAALNMRHDAAEGEHQHTARAAFMGHCHHHPASVYDLLCSNEHHLYGGAPSLLCAFDSLLLTWDELACCIAALAVCLVLAASATCI